jgi:hypothetical protein
MVVNDSQQTTMKSMNAEGTATPSFMKMMRDKGSVTTSDGTMKAPPKVLLLFYELFSVECLY